MVLCFFKKRKLRRRYDISNYIAEVAKETTDAQDHGVQLISYKKINTDSEECATEFEEGQDDTSNGKSSVNQLQISAHPHGAHSYDLLACNV